MQIDSTTNLVVNIYIYIHKKMEIERKRKKDFFRQKQNTVTIDKQHLERKKKK